MNSLEANVRNNSTKGQLNAIRNSGNVPAIIYGGKDQNQKISISKKMLKNLIDKENFLFTQLSAGMAYNNFESAELDDQNSNVSSNLSIPFCSIYASIENTQHCSIIKGGLTREFYIYIPSSYSEYISPPPILFSLHGGGDYAEYNICLLYTSPSPRDATLSRMPSSA